MIGRNAECQITFTVEDREEIVGAFKEIFQTEIGRTYKEDYYTEERGDEDCEKILRGAELLTGGPNITVVAMTRALQFLMDSGELQPIELVTTPELVEPEPDTRPRTKDGKLMTPAQIAWSEYRTFAESHSSEECRRRAREDAGFGNFMRKNLEREMAVEIDDAVVPVGDRGARVAPTAELAEFARKYNSEPVANFKPKGGFVRLAGEQIPYGKFLDLVDKASAIRLI